MLGKKITVYARGSTSDENSDTVWLDEHLMRAMRITDGRPIWLTVGSFRLKVIVRASTRQKAMLLPQQLLQRFGMHDGLRLRIRYDENSTTLRCGPLLAVLLQRGNNMPYARPFGEMSDFCRELALAAKREHVWLAAVTPRSFHLQQRSMQGWTYKRGWRRVKLPMADVIYNRLQTRKLEKSRSVQTLLRHIKSHFSTVLFNEQFLDKISVFAALAKDTDAQAHLPHSRPCREIAVIRQMLDKYGVLFLKPTSGSMGRGIVRIERRPDGAYATQTTHLNSTSRQSFANQAALLRHLGSRIRKKPHLIQQGLSLLSVYRHNLDFRALVQKDQRGAWTITSIVARIAAPRHFVSNVARGGKLMTVVAALLKAGVAREQARKLHTRLRKTALLIASVLEKQMGGNFGELGVDLAIDTNQQVWLLEVNSKPSKTDPQLPGAGKIRPSARKAVQYATFAAKF